MQTIHAVLAIPRLYRDAFTQNLHPDFDVSFVDEPLDEWAIACNLRTLLNGDISVDDPVIVVTSIDEADDIPALCSRLLTEFPEITIMGICRNTSRIRSFQLRIQVEEIHCSLSDLNEAIRECTRNSLPW